MGNTCGTTLDSFSKEDGDLDILQKYTDLMQASIGEESIYMRAKDTYSVIFKDLQITESEKAKIVSESVNTIIATLSATAMQTSLQWAKDERDGAYSLAKVKADTDLAIAQAAKVAEEICLAEKQTEKVCADITATIAGSIRDNGSVATYDADSSCTPTALNDEGLKYQQTLLVASDTYSKYADAFRKSGVVDILTDAGDNTLKGMSGDDAGYTWQQSENAERQRIAYEDSKRTHAANSAASMIGQMLTAEVDTNADDVNRWRKAVDFLLEDYVTTPAAGNSPCNLS